jgi:hypothetical protein
LTPQVPKPAANVEEATQPATHTPVQPETTVHVSPSSVKPDAVVEEMVQASYLELLEGYKSDDDSDEEEVCKQLVENNTEAKVVEARATFTPILDRKSIADLLKRHAGPKVMSMVIAMEGTKRYLMRCVTNV